MTAFLPQGSDFQEVSLHHDGLAPPVVLNTRSPGSFAYDLFMLRAIPDANVARASLEYADTTSDGIRTGGVSWTPLATNVSTTGKPRAVSWPDGRLDVFAFDIRDGTVLHKWRDDRTASGWQPRLE
jgi:hypothetical protein